MTKPKRRGYALAIEKINATAELERSDVQWEAVGEEEIRFVCPFHEDQSPSFNLNTERNIGKCHACGTSADIIGVLGAKWGGIKRQVVIADLSERYDIDEIKSIKWERAEECHQRIWEEAGPLKTELLKRGLTDEDIRTHRLGFHNGRITIPVKDLGDRCVNIRRYLPGAPGSEKMKNTPGYGEKRIYCPKQLRDFDQSWFCAGEMKAIVAQRLLNPLGIGAWSVTAAEGTWDAKWDKLIKGKEIYVCMDIDEAGKKASAKLARWLTRAGAKSIFLVNLPLDPLEHPKGDLNDYVASKGATGQMLFDLMTSAQVYETGSVQDQQKRDEVAVPVELGQVANTEFSGRRVEVSALPVAADTSPYLLPSRIVTTCSQDQKCCVDCSIPAVLEQGGLSDAEIILNKNSVEQLRFIDCSTDKEDLVARSVVGIPRLCRVVSIRIKERRPVYDIRIAADVALDPTARASNVDRVSAYTIGEQVELNTPHTFTAVPCAHPKDQKLVLVCEDSKPSADGLDEFSPSREDLDALRVFRPESWTLEAIDDKLNSLYEDLEANVTHIFLRRPLHQVMDLVWHSPLFLKFQGREVPGWINALVVGDSAQGKSETAYRLAEYYGLGVRTDCKNASRAGVVGSVKQIGKRWFITWGMIPANDRRLVVLEEAKGLRTEEIATMTDMRSSGIAELTKVEHAKARARTRLLWISNPRKLDVVSSFSYGVEAIPNVIGSPEDVRRFDIGLVVSKEEVSHEDIEPFLIKRPRVKNEHASELCRRLILFAWTRSSAQIRFSEGVERECILAADRMTKKFDSGIPLIDHGTTRFKLARLAASLAVRTFSVLDEALVIRSCHVQWVERFLTETYSNPHFGYGEWSDTKRRALEVRDVHGVELWIRRVRFPRDFVQNCLGADEITREDLEDWCEMDRDESRRAMSFLVRKRCLHRKGRIYVKSPEYISILKSLEEDGVGLPDENEVTDEEEM